MMGDLEKTEGRSNLTDMERKLLDENHRLRTRADEDDKSRFSALDRTAKLETDLERAKENGMFWIKSLVFLAGVCLMMWIINSIQYHKAAAELEKIAKEKEAAVESLHIGEKEVVPLRNQVRVRNPEPISVGGRTLAFNDECYIEPGGTATIVAVKTETGRAYNGETRVSNTYYLRYEGDPKYDESCLSGVIFSDNFWSADRFRNWSEEYARIVRQRDEDIAKAKEILTLGVVRVEAE